MFHFFLRLVSHVVSFCFVVRLFIVHGVGSKLDRQLPLEKIGNNGGEFCESSTLFVIRRRIGRQNVIHPFMLDPSFPSPTERAAV
jgi:hypothetical protein